MRPSVRYMYLLYKWRAVFKLFDTHTHTSYYQTEYDDSDDDDGNDDEKTHNLSPQFMILHLLIMIMIRFQWCAFVFFSSFFFIQFSYVCICIVSCERTRNSLTIKIHDVFVSGVTEKLASHNDRQKRKKRKEGKKNQFCVKQNQTKPSNQPT